MILCEFCLLYEKAKRGDPKVDADGECSNGHRIPTKMRCVDFLPGIERFCASPADFTGPEQIKQMALFFGLAGNELKRVEAMSRTISRVKPDIPGTA